ncbi:MAG: glycosyltransferase [Flavobacteriales bacterium]|nr:glycosyltransferase [Flavobacteriales bacterium]
MPSRKNIVIFVTAYPYGFGEAFFEEEIKVLDQNFDHIRIVITTDQKLSDTKTFCLPTKVKLVKLTDYKKSIDLSNKFSSLFSIGVWVQLYLAKFKHLVPFSVGLVAQIVNCSRKGKAVEMAIERFIANVGIEAKNTMFYSYWCDSTAIALANMASKDDSIKFITRMHRWDLYYEKHKIPFLPFRELILSFAHRVICISEDGKDYLSKKDLIEDPTKIIVSKLGVKELGLNVAYSDKSSAVQLVVLSLSLISPVKRLDKLVTALSQISNIEIHWHHIGGGEKEFEDEIENTINEKLNNKPNVKVVFHGMKNKKEIDVFLVNQPINIFVNCSDSEGIPVSIMEAMSASIPVIAYNVGGISEIVTTKNGILLEQDNDDSAQCLTEALQDFSQLPNEEKIEMSNNARRTWRDKYNAKQNFEFMVDILNNNEKVIDGM